MSAALPPALPPVLAGMSRAARWGLGAQALAEWIEQVLDLGITGFDHADVYGGYTVEALFGDALALAPALRQRMQIVTKCGIRAVSPQRPQHASRAYDSSRAHVLASVHASLRALRTDRIDLLLLHQPDPLLDPDELASMLRELLAAGKVLRFGVCNHSPTQLALLRKRHPVAVHQFEFSPLQMKALADGTLDQCTDLAVQPMAWGVLGAGRLLNGSDEQVHRVRAVLQDLGHEHGGRSLVTMACAWVQRHPSRPRLVIGSRRIETLRDAMAASQLQLGAEAWYRVWQASIGHELP
jgi:predicted oxidoreductase